MYFHIYIQPSSEDHKMPSRINFTNENNIPNGKEVVIIGIIKNRRNDQYRPECLSINNNYT